MQPKTTIGTALVLFLFLATGCVANQPKDGPPVGESPNNTKGQVVVGTEVVARQSSEPTATTTTHSKLKPEEIIPEKPGLNLGGQTITGHEVSKRWGMDKMTFTTAQPVPGKKFWAFVCDELADGQIPSHVSFYWHRDDDDLWLKRNPNEIAKMAKEIRSDTCWIALHRPHSRSGGHWRSQNEMRLHLALVDYFIATFGINRFDVYGSSGGGTVAAMVLQERRRHVTFAGLASPVAAVKARDPHVSNWWVYDPHYHLERLTFRTSETLPVCILIVWDPKDKTVNEKGVLPYIEGARELGLGEDRVKLVRVHSRDRLRHFTSHKNLGREMRKLRREGDFCL